jgi:hypothetical protein
MSDSYVTRMNRVDKSVGVVKDPRLCQRLPANADNW